MPACRHASFSGSTQARISTGLINSDYRRSKGQIAEESRVKTKESTRSPFTCNKTEEKGS